MRYLVLLAVGFLLVGCPDNGPDCHCPEREVDLFMISAVHAPDGGVLSLSWIFDHEQSTQYSPLDCSCPGNWIKPKVVRFSSSGQQLWTITNELAAESGYAVFYAAQFLGSELVLAGYSFGHVERLYGYNPAIVALNESNDVVRYVRIESTLFGTEQDYPQQNMRVLALADGSFLFYGNTATGLFKVLKVSSYGEVLWTIDSATTQADLGTYYAMPDGGYMSILANTGAEWIGPDGALKWSREIVHSPDVSLRSCAPSGDSLVVFAGSYNQARGTDAILWTYNVHGSLIDSLIIPFEGNQDSVHVAYNPFNAEYILACRNAVLAESFPSLLIMRIGPDGALYTTNEINGRSYLADFDIDENGSLLVSASTNLDRYGGWFYGKVIRYYADYTEDWSNSILP